MEILNLKSIVTNDTQGHSSKGNQLKWKYGGYWYKADYMGYEGLAEVVISRLLLHSNVGDYVKYEPVQIEYRDRLYNGCRSVNFLMEGEELVTVDHLFRQYTGQNLTSELAQLTDTRKRIMYLVEMACEYTRIKDYGKYMAMTLEMDAFFLNEDRHTNNIALIYNPATKTYKNSPHFDNGLALFSDMGQDFPLEKPLQDYFKAIVPKPFCSDFDEQADEAATLYGRQLILNFRINDVQKELQKFAGIYEDKILTRVEEVFRSQIRKYTYLFS